MPPQIMLGDYRGCGWGQTLRGQDLIDLLISTGSVSFWGFPVKRQICQESSQWDTKPKTKLTLTPKPNPKTEPIPNPKPNPNPNPSPNINLNPITNPNQT